MDALLRAIRDLDPTTFHQLCFQVMSEKYPNAGIQYVEGAAGDEGLDNFAGTLSVEPAIWQCKAFQTTLIGDPQKAQIRESLRRAVQNFKPKVWILCLNMNLDTKAHRWFQRLQKSYGAQGLAVANPFQAIDLARELMFRRTLREHYFPGLVLNAAELRSLITRTSDMPDSALEKLATENVEQWLDRIKDKDPRFTYEVTFGGDRGPDEFFPRPEPGLIASFSDGRKIVKAFVRDPEALRRDPVGVEILISGSGVNKVFDFLKTGKEQMLEGGEVIDFVSTMPFLADTQFDPEKGQLFLQSLPDQKLIPLRITFSTASESVTLSYVQFRKTRHGGDEVEIETVQDFPLYMRLVLPRQASPNAQITVSKHFVGKSIRKVAPASNALRLLQEGCNVELFSLELNAKLGEFSAPPLKLGLKSALFSFIDDLSAISTRFACDIHVPHPDEVTDKANEIFSLLRALVRNEPVQLSNVTVKVVKSTKNTETLPQLLAKSGWFRVEHADSSAVLFGSNIAIGPIAMQFQGAVNSLQQTISRFRRTKIGDSVAISVRPLAPVQYLFLPSPPSLSIESS